MDTLRIISRAFLGMSIKKYPSDGNGKIIEAKAIIDQINGQLNAVNFSSASAATDADVDKCLGLARESLDEVKTLTEYQDQKTARLLTIVAFLTAAAGAVFSKVLDAYPLHQIMAMGILVYSILTCLVYAVFALFLLFVAMGALVSFHAMQTRFIWDEEPLNATGNHVKSYLFFRGILSTKPDVWASSFLDSTEKSKPNPNLREEYFKNYIAEAYIVAAKVADKIACLESAQNLLLYSIRLLVLWILSLTLVAIFVPSIGKNDRVQQDAYVITHPSTPPLGAPVSCVAGVYDLRKTDVAPNAVPNGANTGSTDIEVPASGFCRNFQPAERPSW